MKKFYQISLITVLFMFMLTSLAAAEKKEFTRDELKIAFDAVGQNFGAFQYSYFTFTIEFERPPNDVQELLDSGHIMVNFVNPYNDTEVHLGAIGEKPKAAGLYYRKVNEEWAEFEAYFVNPNKPTMLRSLNTAAVKHTQEEMKKMVFGDDASRPEQLTRVYLLQLNDAIESFEQKIGRIPESLEEMAAIGDVNVFYINPFTKAPVKNTDKLSPGDYMYRRFKADDSSGEYFYEVVGWGEKEPVYYFSTDESREMFDWNETDADETI